MSWTAVLSVVASWGSDIAGTEVLFDPANGNIAYAVLGGSNDPGNGVYKSTDAGLTWARADAAGSSQLPTAGVGRIALAMAASSTSTLYAGISDSSTYGFTGLYKSLDGGTNWTQIPSAPNYCGGQCPFVNVVAVSPTNANAVFVGGNTDVIGGIASGTAVFWRSLDGGATWTIISCCSASSNGAIHIDQKAFAFSSDGATLYVGNDGGVWSTTGAGASTPSWTNLNSSLALTQFYPGLSIDPSNVDIAFGGTQDNGIQQYAGGVWQSVTCGDGGQTVIDPVQPTNIYASCGTQVQKSTSGGGPNSWSAASTGIDSADRAVPVYPPLAIDPSNHLSLYFGTYRVYQSGNGAASWTAISPDLTFGDGTLMTIAVAPSDSNTVYVGANDGRVHVTTNAGAGASAAWTDRTPGLPSRSVTQISVDSLNPLVAFVTFSGFSGFGGDTQGHVFQTVNGGASWSDVSGNLPNSPADGIVIDPDQSNTLYVATDIGVFATVDGGITWYPPGTGLPRGAVTALALHRPTRILRAATHGRSVWDLQLAAPAPQFTPDPGTVLSDSLADFTWTAVSGATEYQLTVGTTPGGTNIFSGTSTGTSQSVGSIPCADTVGGTIYVQLAAEVNGSFQPATAYTYKCKSGLGDFNGDGYQDVLWQNNSTNQVSVHYFDGTQGVTYTGWNWLNSIGESSGWVLVGAADFDGNGVPDLVWEYMTTGQVTVNYYGGPGGATLLGWSWLNETGNPGWTVVAVADMNGDGVPDLIWQNNTTNQVTVNYYGGAGGATLTGWNWLNSGGEPAGWHVVAAADFDGNGTPDLVWQYAPTRQVTVNYYGGTGGATYQGWNWLNSTGDAGWTVVGANDFNGDGVPDLVWQNDTTAQVTVNYYGGSKGASLSGWNWLAETGYPGWTAVVPR